MMTSEDVWAPPVYEMAADLIARENEPMDPAKMEELRKAYGKERRAWRRKIGIPSPRTKSGKAEVARQVPYSSPADHTEAA